MAINPNTDFTTGAILTAAQQNRFPRGVMAYTESTTSDTSITVEETEFNTSFTAVANRYYKITYYEPDIGISGAGAGAIVLRLRQTSLTGTVLQTAYQWIPSSAVDTAGMSSVIKTFSAGTVAIYATAQQSGAVTFTLNRASTKPAYLLIEDIGPS